jgi:tetratricopeptide (TPR) repeat protein
VLDNVDDARFLISDQADGHDQAQTTNARVIRKPLHEYLPHCERGSILVTTRDKEAALKLVEQRDIVFVEPMDNLAATYQNQGLDVQVMEMSKKKLGADHPDTLNSMNNLAHTYMNQGRWDDAKELQVQVMETRKKKLGVDHPDTLRSMNNLAFTLKSLRKNKEALRLLRECVQLSQHRFRADHPDLVTYIASLAQWDSDPQAVV